MTFLRPIAVPTEGHPVTIPSRIGDLQVMKMPQVDDHIAFGVGVWIGDEAYGIGFKVPALAMPEAFTFHALRAAGKLVAMVENMRRG